jgi:C4-dicarboxylate-specific signal transduction histidine kinase
MSTLFKNTGQADSALHYAHMVVQGWTYPSEFKNLLEAVSNLAQVYKAKGTKDSAFKYTELSYAIKDSIFSAEKDRAVQRIAFEAQLKEEELRANQIEYNSKVQLSVLITGLLVLFLITAILWRNNRQKQKAKAKIEQAYTELKATQAQLIQKEKMASLGELTAGIAHEIQNPLNFVNNFSEVSVELIDDLKKEAAEGNSAEVIVLANEVADNLQKVVSHGKRADSIVKGMLLHARASTGKKEPVNLKYLTDEYLRLAYQGSRAKDKAFSARIETSFDETIGQVNVVPQDIGRVLLNLFSNALYAVAEKKKKLNGTFEPTVSVSTKREGDSVVIAVKDNGIGMPPTVSEKIFQPFFTTKPTGEGTGLGLSLSYDIITKGHGGELRVESREGEGSEFLVQLPIF